ncbi:hypothetical protein B0T11DRAFT_106920 [Plectosphaerella cucumerina]|uniref:Uncharacterized protein n=1 Tax=Plectosphaerella cucumerina TaxID=40658 RepID=A0A8K0T9E4_9PEZI|nr:hypothetical protein B0T11DRAFT_106920 [Plectosphaerella cucumerina]
MAISSQKTRPRPVKLHVHLPLQASALHSRAHPGDCGYDPGTLADECCALLYCTWQWSIGKRRTHGSPPEGFRHGLSLGPETRKKKRVPAARGRAHGPASPFLFRAGQAMSSRSRPSSPGRSTVSRPGQVGPLRRGHQHTSTRRRACAPRSGPCKPGNLAVAFTVFCCHICSLAPCPSGGPVARSPCLSYDAPSLIASCPYRPSPMPDFLPPVPLGASHPGPAHGYILSPISPPPSSPSSVMIPLNTQH